MSKKDFDKFLGKKSNSPLNTDKIYGGLATKAELVVTVVKTVTKKKVKE